MTVKQLKNKLEHLPDNMEVFMENEIYEGDIVSIESINIRQLNMRHPDDEESQEPILEMCLILCD